MPTVRIPLVGTYNQRGIDGNAALVLNEDQRFSNGRFNVVTNPVTGKSTAYLEKRPGFTLDSFPAANANYATGIIKPQSFNAILSAFGQTNSQIFLGTNDVGTITGRALHFTEAVASDVSYVMIKSSDGTGWFFAEDANDTTAYTMDGNNSTTVTDIKIAGANSTAGLYPGQKLTAASNIVAGTRVVSVNSGAFTAVLDTATTGGVFNDLAVTKEPIAKIIDADFVTTGTYIGAFVEMDGYLFYPTDDGNIRNSDLNSVTSYTSTAFRATSMSPDNLRALARQNNYIIALGSGSIEAFRNAGYSSGSPLERVIGAFKKVGVLDQKSVVSINDDIYFISSPNTGDMGLWRIRGLQLTKVSTPILDRIIGNASPGGSIYLSAFQLAGHTYIGMCFTLASDSDAEFLLLESGDKMLLEDSDDIILEGGTEQGASLVRQVIYNADLNIPSEWSSPAIPGTFSFVAGDGSGTSNKIFLTGRTVNSSQIFRIDPSADGALYTDSSANESGVVSTQIRTARIDHGTAKRKFVKEIRFVGDTQSTGTATLEASDDDYQSWFTLGTFDLTIPEPKITRCGSYKGGRAYRLTHSANAAFRAEAIEIDYEVGT